MKIGPYCQQQKCNPLTLVPGNTRFMLIFTRVPWRGHQTTVGWSQRPSSVLSFVIFLETLQMRSKLLYGDMETLVSFLLNPKRVTLNDLLCRIFMPVYLAWEIVDFEGNSMQTNEDKPTLSVMRMFSMNSSF